MKSNSPEIPADVIRELLGPWSGGDGSRVEAIRDGALRTRTRSVRLNGLSRRVSAADLPFVGEAVPWGGGDAYFVEGAARPGGHVLYGTGAYYVMESSSLLAVSVLDAQPGERICDLCAAPGGKATAIVDGVGAEGFLLANEAVRSRLGALQFNLARHGGWRYAVSNLDPEKLADRLGGQFDAVLVDAPCSGQSMVARGKQRASGFGHKSVSLNAKRQARILRAAAKLVAPGGRLVYSTCTYSWAENEAQIEAVLGAETGRWQAEEVPGLEAYLAGGPAPEACYRLWPDRHGCTGAFAARLRKVGNEAAVDANGAHSGRQRHGRGARTVEIPWSDWGEWRGRPEFQIGASACQVVPINAPGWAKQVGTFADTAYRKGRSWFPSYALAMRRDEAFVPMQRHALSHEEARAYLGGHPVSCGTSGWCVCTYEERPLGWGKASHGTMANHLPATARLHVE